MGQAFDREGALLGEAEAATKREVFETLQAAFPDAEEIRIRTLRESNASTGVTPLPGEPRVAERMLRWFEYAHLPEPLQFISRQFSHLAHDMCARLRPGPERTVMLRKLLEAKDAAVRQQLEDGRP